MQRSRECELFYVVYLTGAFVMASSVGATWLRNVAIAIFAFNAIVELLCMWRYQTMERRDREMQKKRREEFAKILRDFEDSLRGRHRNGS